MPTYQSRHQPRRQMIVSGKIQNAQSYDRFYDIATDAMLRGELRGLTLPAGRLVLRAVGGNLSIEQARCIAPGSSMNGNNRFSGPRLDGRHGQGALYVGGVLRLTSLAAVIQKLRASGEAKSRYGGVDWAPFDMLVSAASDSQDDSAARGLADPVYDQRSSTGFAGVCAASSRADTDSGLVIESHGDATGGLIFAIFGHDGAPVVALEPAAPKADPNAAVFDTFDAIAAAVS